MKCKNCNSDFEIPRFAIDMVYAKYCQPCIKKGLKKYAELSPKEVIELEAKRLLK